MKLNNIGQIQVCKNHGPLGSGEAIIGENFTCIYIGKIFLKSSSEESLAQKS
jgi:hypothetical protein